MKVRKPIRYVRRIVVILGCVAFFSQVLFFIFAYKSYKLASTPSSPSVTDDIISHTQQERYNQQKNHRKPRSGNDLQGTNLLLNIPLYGSSGYIKRGTNILTNLERLDIHCEKLIQGDSAYVKKTKMTLVEHKKIVLSPEVYLSLTKSCDNLIKSRGYVMDVSKEEEEFPIAYNIIMHHDIEMAERLLRSIYRPSNIYCIHVDRKSPINLFKAMSSIAKCFDNVIMASHRSKVIWGQYSIFQAELTCMDDLLKYKKWKYFINLAGQEFPLKTNLEIVRILGAFRGANSVSGAPFREEKLLLATEAMARYKIWSDYGLKCSGKWIRNICIFGMKELPGLTKAPHLFSNKHHSDYQPATLDCLEKWLFDKIHNEQQGKSSNINLSFYMNQDFVKNQIP